MGSCQSTAIPLLLVDGTNRYVYGPDGTPIERLGNAKADTRWLGRDTQHSITLATDDSANVTTTNTYTPWGAVRAHTGETINLGYDAQYTDPETDFIYLRARYYDPGTAQFLTRDPIEPVTRSAYGYAANSPLNLTDPMGLAPWDGVVDFFTGGDCGDGFLDRAFGGVDELVWEHRDEIILVLALVGTASCPMCTVAFYASMGLSAVSTLHACNSGDRTSCALGVAALVTAGAGRALTRGAAPRLGAAADARLGASRWHLLQSNVTGPILRAGAIAARRTGFWSGWASDALSGVDVVNG